MNKVPDRAKVWREYKLRHAGAIILSILGACLAAFAALNILGAIWFTLTDDPDCDSDGFPACTSVPQRLVYSIPTALVGVLLFAGGKRLFRVQLKKANDMPYVPPVRDQLPTLPADEVLLRGSQATPAPPEELLRPAGRQDSAQGELLRATTGGKGE